MVSQSYIARKLNLSQRTVSLCLAGSEKVADNTRRRVLAAAQDLGYRPNRSARAMRSGRFNAIALLQSTHPYLSYLPEQLLGGIQTALAERQQQLVVAAVPDEKLVDADYLPSVLREWSVDGFLVNYNYGFSPRMVEVIEENHLPSIWLNTKRPYDCVYPDDLGAGRKATEKLLDLGHRRIAFFCHRRFEDHFSVGDRYAGYEQAMRAAGLPSRTLFYPDADWHGGERGLAFISSVLSASDRPTAIVSYESFEAMRVVLAAFKLGLEFPRDLSLITFAASEFANSAFPVATQKIPEMEMGRSAVQMLLTRIESDATPRAPAHQPPAALEFTELTVETMGVPPPNSVLAGLPGASASVSTLQPPSAGRA
jgi:LacI family transcriptional regulator